MPRLCFSDLRRGIQLGIQSKILYLGQTLGLLWGSALILGAGGAGAVDQVQVDWGVLKTTVTIADLEAVATTGQVPPHLRFYRPLLTVAVQQTLTNPLSLDPAISDRFITELLTSSNGQHLLERLLAVVPGVNPEVLQEAIQTAAEDENGFNILAILRALPGETLTLEGRKLLSLLVQLGLSHLEQAALSGVLNRALEATPVVDTTFDPATPGPVEFKLWSLKVRDRDRDRSIPIDVYWSRHTRGPLVILSHGFGADRYFLAYLAEHLASYGLTVVAIEHPGSNVAALSESTGAILPAQEFVDRPLDVTLVLDRLAEINQTTFPLRGSFNLEEVTLVGHSLGGYTGLVLAGARPDQQALTHFCQGLQTNTLTPADWLQCAATDLVLPDQSLADDRITQLVVMNPIIGQLFGPEGLRQITVPTLMVTGTQDSVTPITTQQLRPFDQLSGPRALVAIIGGTHLSVGDPKNINPALTRIPFMPELPTEETAQLRQYLQGTVLSFLMQQTPAAHRYQPFLSATYAQSFSTEILPLRYSNHLPEPVSRWLWAQENLHRYLTPTWERVASLAHLELIGLQQQFGALGRRAMARFPLATTIPVLFGPPIPETPEPQTAYTAISEGAYPIRE
ncbi:alpha/beta hydrolase [Leptolyngbya sp. PCC 6406]|uniref:alpha/beta hydrolase n=1 Tax=Leptolyngbya sp. PCC 6406 TaxID=1173264 RepID=UPI0002AD0BEE|nr:alpha/beta hydrolase [Leptolyngbya sp. PCC 6406]